jgi:PAS domain S-box-containing protein
MPADILSDQSRPLLASIVESSDDAIVSKDLKGVIMTWNRAAERIFGYTADEAIGQSILMLIPKERWTEEPEILERIGRGERIQHFETIRLTKDKRLIEISLSISPIRNADGVIMGASKIVRDISDRKKVERDLAAAQEELQFHASSLEKKIEERTLALQRTIAELEAFSYSLTHDMRAPLRAIQSYLQIFMEDHGTQVDAEGIDILQRALSSTQRMDDMVLDLLAFTRLSHELMPVETVDAEKIIRAIIHERPALQPPKAEIIIQSPLLNIMGNIPSLAQCLTNLLDNAVKFVSPGTVPHVKIYTEQAGSMVRLYVEDNGIGIKAEDKDQLFRMFSRIPGNNFPGTGIGLAIVRKAAGRMGGTADVESMPLRGSRFWLELPEAKA